MKHRHPKRALMLAIAIVGVAAIALSASIWKYLDDRQAQLVVQSYVGTGNASETLKYRNGGVSATASVYRSYNALTGEEWYEGDLDSIYHAMGGRDRAPRIVRVQSLLRLMEQQGWQIVSDTTDGERHFTTQTILFQRPARN